MRSGSLAKGINGPRADIWEVKGKLTAVDTRKYFIG